MWKKFQSETMSKIDIQKSLQESRLDAQKWEKKSKEFIIEFQGHVLKEFEIWGLSKSEKEIASLLLQGKSSKEISALRFTSERTIRNQCRAIYEKSNFSGKSELSAHFLNELINGL